VREAKRLGLWEKPQCIDLWYRLLKKAVIVKTPATFDPTDSLAKHDKEDYQIDLAAQAADCQIVTRDADFSALSNRCITPKDFLNKAKVPAAQPIAFLDLKSSHIELRPQLEAAFDRTLNAGWYIQGTECKQFEQEFAQYCQAEHCIGVGNGVVAANPATADSFKSYAELGLAPTAPACKRVGLSVLRSFEDAIHQTKLFPKHGRCICRAELTPEHGKTLATKGTLPTHTTWWPFKSVDRVAPFAHVYD
jgi:hypothetical protein